MHPVAIGNHQIPGANAHTVAHDWRIDQPVGFLIRVNRADVGGPNRKPHFPHDIHVPHAALHHHAGQALLLRVARREIAPLRAR